MSRRRKPNRGRLACPVVLAALPATQYTLVLLLLWGALLIRPPSAIATDPIPLTHDRAHHVLKHEWMRDPYIYLHGDGWCYLTCTRLGHILFGDQGIEIWKSKNLVDWESVGVAWSFENSTWLGAVERSPKDKKTEFWLQAPELYFIDEQWIAVHTTNRRRANLLVSQGGEYNDSWKEPFGTNFGHRHDPSIFTDSDGAHWLVWACTKIRKLKSDFSAFDGEEIAIAPSDRKLGHEGCTIRKIGKKYVLFGTAWSMDDPRQGTYNLYYCTADKLTGPYGPRKFAGRFCGHGTPFKDKQGRWWTTAFQNGKHEPDPQKGQLLCDQKLPWTINPQGLTLVPLEVEVQSNGDTHIRAKPPRYSAPGPEEVQNFPKVAGEKPPSN